jgi:hypothetical protein
MPAVVGYPYRGSAPPVAVGFELFQQRGGDIPTQ